MKKGNLDEIWNGIANQAELRLEVPEVEWWYVGNWRLRKRWVQEHEGHTDLLHAIERLLKGTPYVMVLEKDRLRILYRNDAYLYWRSWWQQTQNKDP